jgi:hypothetical protein
MRGPAFLRQGRGRLQVGAAAWPFLSLPAGAFDNYGGPTMFHGRVAVLPIQFQRMFATRVQIKLHLQQWARASAAPREQLVH